MSFIKIILLTQFLTYLTLCLTLDRSNYFPVFSLWLCGILIGMTIGEKIQERKNKGENPQNSQQY
ncbi:hypothetical protein [Acinetobacter radioresistens]|uniref:hypothetical protein n=1 Tax=Acinetobacter radioresistens TaxID=40216 RepID=UPI0004535FB0|nr:hypothetical protein [Acinetobacter radioresistens]EXB32264.1 hypothetical protein J546_2292 [Acinetobacter sp. 1461402]MCU4517829.1 hypothetical protein [Acinetobacter radioresistens]